MAMTQTIARPRGARWWWIFGVVLFVGVLTWGAYQVLALLAHEERTELTTHRATGITALDVVSGAGDVEVVAADTADVTVRARISDGLRATGEEQRVVGETLELRASCPNFGSDWCSVDYEIEVPRDLAVRIRTDRGAIDVRGTSGPIEVDGDNGSVDLIDVSGSVVASTDNGSIEGVGLRAADVTADSDNGGVRLTFVAPPTAVTATTDNGSVDVVVPADGTAYRLDVESDNGDTTEAIPIDSSSPRSITVRTDNGSATVRAA
jgi:hypothetical protein